MDRHLASDAGSARATRPLVVVDAPDPAFDEVVRQTAAAGWQIQPGFTGGPTRGRSVRVGTVASAADAEYALLAALDGAGLVVRAVASRDVLDRLVDDLRHLGPVDHLTVMPDRAPVIDPEARAILGLLAEGYSLGDAATVLGLSRRTADRRLAAGRRVLGVERTTEAIAKARRLGWLGPGQPPPERR